MSIRDIEVAIAEERYDEAIKLAKNALSTPECLYQLDNCMIVQGYMLFCYTELQLFDRASKMCDDIHAGLHTHYNYPEGDNPTKRSAPDWLMAYLTAFCANYCVGMGDRSRASLFLEAAVIYTNKMTAKHQWLDNEIVLLTHRIIHDNIEQNRTILERNFSKDI